VQRLRDSGRLIVIAVPDPLRCGMGQPVIVWFRTVPGAAPQFAHELAARPDVRYVALLAGGHDLLAEIIVPDQRYLQKVVMEELPNGGSVQQSSTALVLKRFKTRDQWSGAVLDGTTDWGEPTTVASHRSGVPLDEVDSRIVAALRVDGRRGYSDIATTLGLSETTVARRMAALTADQRLNFIAMVDPVALGFRLEAIINFRVEPAAIEATATRLVGSPQVRYLAATTGTSDLTCDGVFKDTDDLYDFLNDTVAGIRGIVGARVDVVLEAVKREYHYPLFVPPGTAAPVKKATARANGRKPAAGAGRARRASS
jgi:DNA-binding Lrp family transcriptional regulator